MSFTQDILKRLFEQTSQKDQKIQPHTEIADKPLELPVGCVGATTFLNEHQHMGTFLLYPYPKNETQERTLKYELARVQETEQTKIDHLLQKEQRLPGFDHWGLPKGIDSGQCKNYEDITKASKKPAQQLTGMVQNVTQTQKISVHFDVHNTPEMHDN